MQVTFQDLPKLSSCDMIATRLWRITDDCGKTSTFTQIVHILPLQFPVTPQNGEVNVDLYHWLQWPQYPNSEKYRVYIWRFGTERPYSSTKVSFDRVYAPQVAYPDDTRILWQVEYVLQAGFHVNNISVIPSPIWGFKTKQKPNFKLVSVSVPSYTFSGRSFEISWNVKNVGSRGTSVYSWYDRVYISLSGSASRGILTKTVRRQSFLDPGDGYTGKTSLQVPANIIGNYFVFVETDIYRQTSDIDTRNNKGRGITVIQIKLTPPPDLQVKSVVAPVTTFSGKSPHCFNIIVFDRDSEQC